MIIHAPRGIVWSELALVLPTGAGVDALVEFHAGIVGDCSQESTVARCQSRNHRIALCNA